MAIVIGISGVSRAGKGTLSTMIKDWYPDQFTTVLHMDDFVFPKEQLPRIRDEIDWEVPESVDYSRMAISIGEEKKRNDLIIVEGILIFNNRSLLGLFDRKIFVEIDYDTFIDRKRQDKRWSIPDWYMEHIWTSYIIHGQVNNEDALMVNGKRPFDQKLIMEFING